MSSAPAVWVWVGHMGLDDRIQLTLENYGDRITDISIFGWSVMRSGELVETFDPTQLDPYREKWPHIRFWLCFRNMDGPDAEEVGPRAIFDALRDSTEAQQRLAVDVGSIFEDHPWLYGVDIDLESGGDDRSEESEAIFQVVADAAHNTGRECAAALPPLTVTGSVGGENWVRYAQLGRILDRVEIMSYDFAWAGSAPGPISPGFWMEEVYDWAASQIDPGKLHMGLPLYAYYWRIHDYPPNLGNPWRGISGTFYSFWQQFNGITPWFPGEHPEAAWITYRDPESHSLWGYLHAYDWHQPHGYRDASGIQADRYQGRDYVTRYGHPSGFPQWTIADNSAGDSHIDYSAVAEPIIDVNGRQGRPHNGYTLTVETLKRDPVAATIIDDYASSDQQLGNVFIGGSWEHVEVTSAYSQYRGSGELTFNNSFGDQALYIMGRFQFAQAGTFTVTTRGVSAELRNDGRLRLLVGSSVIDSTTVPSLPTSQEPQSGQAVLALRVRDGSARVYYSTAETSIPKVIEASVSPPGGRTGYEASNEVWIDHTYLGDGWWYQPREAVELSINGQDRLLGRVERNDVEWDTDRNLFRPTSDVDEPETRDPDQWTEYSSLDWGYEHWQGAPIEHDEETLIRVVPVDHETWLGRLIVFDRNIGIVAYCNDVQAVAHWRSRATHDWGLAGVAMWSLGQEDVRLWETFAGGQLPAGTKRLDE